MFKRYQWEDLYKTRLSLKLNNISPTGDPVEEFSLNVSQEPINDAGWLYIDFTDDLKRDKIKFHRKDSNTLYYYRKNRSNPTVTHNRNAFVQLNHVSDWINFVLNNVDDIWVVEDMWDNKARIYGGKVQYDNNEVTLSDSTITELADGTRYAVLDYSDDSLKFVTTITSTQISYATVTVSGWDIAWILDNRRTYLHANKSVIDGFSEYWGNLLWNGVPIWGGAWTGDVVGPSSSLVGGIPTYDNLTGKVLNDSGKTFEAALTDNDDKVPTSKAVKDYVDTAAGKATSYLNNSNYIAGEDLWKWDSLFVETDIQFSDAIWEYNIWSINANTRVAIRLIWNWIESNQLKLSLAKIWTPTENLNFRIENDDWSWNPNGTLYDVNATGSITQASLTTTLADTTITLNDNITITEWDTVWLIIFQWTYGSETIDNENHYLLWYQEKNTTTRYFQSWDWSSWIDSSWSDVTDTWFTLVSSWSNTFAAWYRILTKDCLLLDRVIKDSSCSATRVLLKDDAWVVLRTGTFSANIWTFSHPVTLEDNTYYRIELDNSWSSYTFRIFTSPTYPLVWTNIDYIEASQDGVTVANAFNIASIVTSSIWWLPFFSYVSSDLFRVELLSKTDAKYAYKLPDWPKISNDIYNTWELVKYDFFWISNQIESLSENSVYFLSNTPWSIDTAPGDNMFYIGNSILSNELNLSPWLIGWFDISEDTVYQATSDWYVFASYYKWIWSWNALVEWFVDDTDATTWVVGNSYPTGTTEDWVASIFFPVKKWEYYKISGTTTLLIWRFYINN